MRMKREEREIEIKDKRGRMIMMMMKGKWDSLDQREAGKTTGRDRKTDIQTEENRSYHHQTEW